MRQLIVTTRFKKQAKKLTTTNPQIKAQLTKTLIQLQQDLNHPSLRLHKLSGTSNWSISVNKSIRIIVHQHNNKIYLLDIGTHDNVY